MKQEAPPVEIDVALFAQAQGVLGGQDWLSNYPRLMTESCGHGAERLVHWHARGDLRSDATGVPQVWLHLTLELSLPLTCQRCIGPVDVAVAVNRWFRFVESEQVAEEQDPDVPEDLLVLSSEFNLHDLIEDEVLLALPVVARHETCPVAVRLAVADAGFEEAAAEKRNPFSVLADWKKSQPG